MMPTFIHGANIAFSMKLMLYLRFFFVKKVQQLWNEQDFL